MDNTIKQISEHPASNAVTSPTDKVEKAKDIDRKLTLYSIFEAFRQGKYPSNRQIDETLDYAIHNSPIDHKKLSKDGKMLIQDFRNIINTSKEIVKEKNADELIQNFLYHTRQVDTSKGNLSNKVSVGVKSEEVNQDGAEAVENLRILGKLIFTNSEARKLLKDISLLGRDVLADAAVKASEVARPDEQALARADAPAPSNQWVGPNGETRSQNEPVPSTGLGETSDRLHAHKEDFKSTFQDSASNVQSTTQSAAGVQNESNARNLDQDQVREGASQGLDRAKEEKDRLVGKLSSKIPQEHKDMARENLNKAKDYAKDKFPEERRQRFIYRLKKVIVECQRHRDYQEAIEFFLDKAENYSAVAKDATGQSASAAVDVRNDESFQQAEFELRTLMERFANGQSMQPIFDAVDRLYQDSKEDPELRAFFHELSVYVRACLQEPGYIMKEASDKKGQQLQEQSKRFFDPSKGKYAGHKDDLFDSISTFFSGWAADKLNVQLGKDVKKLTKDLLMDSEGNLKYKPHLWNDIRETILPTLIKNFGGYVPIPRIEYSDNMVDVVIENLTLETANLLPNIIEFEAKNYFKISPYAAIKDQSKHSFWISFSQIQADLKDVAFYVKKKSGFPKLQDSGVADVTISGNGISGRIHIESTGKKHDLFKVIDVKVKIDKLKFAVRDSKHSILIATFKPLATGLIKKAIAAAIQEGIRGALVQIDSQLADISERLEKVHEDDDSVSLLDGYKSVYNDKKNEAKSTKEDLTPPGQFQISAKRESRIVDWSSKNSMVEKQAEKEKLALAGNGWKSPAFDIVRGGANSASTGKGSTQHLTGESTSGNGNVLAGATSSNVGNGHTSTTSPHTTTSGNQSGQSDLSKFVGTHTTNNAQNQVDSNVANLNTSTSTPIAHQYQQSSSTTGGANASNTGSNVDNQFHATGNTSTIV